MFCIIEAGWISDRRCVIASPAFYRYVITLSLQAITVDQTKASHFKIAGVYV
jgi:hypothetical protein